MCSVQTLMVTVKPCSRKTAKHTGIGSKIINLLTTLLLLSLHADLSKCWMCSVLTLNKTYVSDGFPLSCIFHGSSYLGLIRVSSLEVKVRQTMSLLII